MCFDFNRLISESKCVVIPSSVQQLHPFIKELLLSIRTIYGNEQALEIEAGLYEIILNAIEHGNLGITYYEKKEARKRNTYDVLLCQRMLDPKYRNKVVTVCYELTGETACFRVEDQGDGFNWKNRMLNDDGCRNRTEETGRGISIAKIVFDEMTYNQKGNVVTMRKFLRRNTLKD